MEKNVEKIRGLGLPSCRRGPSPPKQEGRKKRNTKGRDQEKKKKRECKGVGKSIWERKKCTLGGVLPEKKKMKLWENAVGKRKKSDEKKTSPPRGFLPEAGELKGAHDGGKKKKKKIHGTIRKKKHCA